MSELQITQSHLETARDLVLGLDPSQTPTDPHELNDRLSIPQPGLAETLALLSHQAGKNIAISIPLTFVIIEAANQAAPDRMTTPIKSKAYMTSVAAVAAEAKAAVDGARDGALRARHPALVEFLDAQLLSETSAGGKLSADDRTGIYALGLAVIRAIDRQWSGAEQPATAAKVPGRNDPCHCGSGRKFKKCHGAPV